MRGYICTSEQDNHRFLKEIYIESCAITWKQLHPTVHAGET